MTSSAEWIPPRVAVVVLSAIWVVLAVTMPSANDRDLTIDVECASGNAVAGVWIESTSGGSMFAESSGPTSAAPLRFVTRQQFPGAYQVRVGCGGTAQQWGIAALSDYDDPAYRRLICDDVAIVDPAQVHCRDLIGR